jgi:dTDP-4-dehydrorhamnose reductase
VVVSIIGADVFSEGYGAATYAHEQAAAAGSIPTRVVRAAQFHEFVPQLVEWGTQGDSAYVQDMWTQAVAARTVAEALVDAATDESRFGPPLVEVAGPREESMVDLAQRYAARHQPGLKIVAVATPEGPDQKIYDEGGLLPGPDARLGGPTFEEWLDSTA